MGAPGDWGKLSRRQQGLKFGGGNRDANKFNGGCFRVWGPIPLKSRQRFKTAGGTTSTLNALFSRLFGGVGFKVWGSFVLHPFGNPL